MTTMEERVGRLEGAYEQVDRRLGDLTEPITRLDAKIDAFRNDLDVKIDAFRNDLDVKIDALRSDMDARFDALRSDMDARFDALRSDMDAKFGAFRSEVNAKFNTLIIVMATGAIGITGALITIAFRI